MGLVQYVKDRIAGIREERGMAIIDGLNEDPIGTTMDDVRDRRGQLDGRLPQRQAARPTAALIDQAERIIIAEAQQREWARQEAARLWPSGPDAGM